MARRKLPARLWWDSRDRVWCILDDGRKRRTGFGQSEAGEAEEALAAYVVRKRAKVATLRNQSAGDVSVAEVLDRYLAHRTENPNPAENVKRPGELAQRISALLDFWGDSSLADVDRDTCVAFAEEIGSPSYARRCLEDFRAAVNHHRGDGYLRDQVHFVLPGKSTPRPDFLSWAEVVALCRTAWRLDANGRRPNAHVAKFVAIAVGTCTRSWRIHQASYVAEPGRPHVDLDRGIYTRSIAGEVVSANKRAPTIPIPPRLLRMMRRWRQSGDRYPVEWGGHAVDPKKGFEAVVRRAREAYPALFKRDDGTPKSVMRHTLRHTGVSMLAARGIDPYEICGFAGMSIKIFESVYAHHHPDHMRGVVRE